MATSFLFNRVNMSGIPCIESQSVSTSTTAVTFTFNPQVLASPRFSGLIAVKITQAADEAGAALPVLFSMGGQIIALTEAGGTAVTGADLLTGIHMVFYDRVSNILQIV
jgi:hypothetical protein